MSQENKYTKPGLRESIKDRVMAGSKGKQFVPNTERAKKARRAARRYKGSK
jgi:hypothetical protein